VAISGVYCQGSLSWLVTTQDPPDWGRPFLLKYGKISYNEVWGLLKVMRYRYLGWKGLPL
jgi:hypothetical protein